MNQSQSIYETAEDDAQVQADKRREDGLLGVLVEVEPWSVVDGVRLNDGYLAEDPKIIGEMREPCPSCTDGHLKLVLRQSNVKREHMFCEKCTRCFDIQYADGTSALSIAP
ncbi:MAG: hypothetical protein V4805_20175 [Pseudomonadota bacterium]